MKKHNPLVSVIIPAYNSGKYIRQCLDSVLLQTWKDLEVIVIDDGSTDNTLDILEDFDVKLIRQDNQGAGAARNEGFRRSSGTCIQFLDADDMLSTNKIESQLEALKRETGYVANGRWGRFYTDDLDDEKIQWGPDISLQEDLDPVSWLCTNHMSQTACWLTPRRLVEKAGLWDESLHMNQDGDFFTRVISHCNRVIYCEEAKVYYRSGMVGSISFQARDGKKIESLFRTCESFEKVLLQLEDSERTRKACADRYQQFVYRVYPQRMDLVMTAEEKIRLFGGSSWPPYKGGLIHNLLMGMFGWKFPAKIRHLLTQN